MCTIYHTQTLPTRHIPKLHSFNFDKSSVQFFSSRNFSSAVEFLLLPASVTRWLDYLFNLWPFTSMKVYDYTYNICQTRLILYYINLQNGQDLLKVAKYRKIWSLWPPKKFQNAIKLSFWPIVKCLSRYQRIIVVSEQRTLTYFIRGSITVWLVRVQ